MRLSLSSEILSSHCTKNISKWDTTVKPKKRVKMATKGKKAEKVPEHLKPVTMTGLKE